MPPRSDGMWCRMVVNGLNTHYDCSVSPTGATTLAWDPDWQSASTIDSDGGHMEIRIPFGAFGAAPPKVGDEWAMNFFRIWQAEAEGMAGQGHTRLAGQRDWRNAMDHGDLGPSPAGQRHDTGAGNGPPR